MNKSWLLRAIVATSLNVGLVMSAHAQGDSFMDLWCQYGGQNCSQSQPRSQPAPSPNVQAPKPQNSGPVRPQKYTKPKAVEPQAPAVATPAVVKAPAPKPAPKQAVVSAPSTPLIVKNAKLAKSKGVVFGRYYALVIGNNGYSHLPKLKSAKGDATEVARVLRDHYGFAVTKLYDATRDQIIGALDEYRKTLKKDDNLLIYYAGHGWLDNESERGYWLPVDADESTRARWVSNADITDTLKALKAKHVMVVADSCYSGTLTRGVAAQTRGLKLTEQPAGYIQTLMSRKSRTVLASGSLEPVSDQGGGKHSVFAYAFLKSLKNNADMIDGTQLFGEVRRQVLLNADQTPQYSNIRYAGHDVGGDFVFLRRDR